MESLESTTDEGLQVDYQNNKILQKPLVMSDSLARFQNLVPGSLVGMFKCPGYNFVGVPALLEPVVHPQSSPTTQLYLSIIDDIIVLWTGTAESLENFVDELNMNQCNIRLTSHYSTTTVDFLDLRIMVRNNRINTTLFRKSTATNNVLHYSSFHPSHLRNSIPKGQFLHLCRNCSTMLDFQMEARSLTNRFQERGYPHKIIARAFKHAHQRSRDEVLETRQRVTHNQLSLITKFHNQWGDVHHILNENWDILLSDPRLKTIIPERPRVVARRARNLKDCLSRSHFKRATYSESLTHCSVLGVTLKINDVNQEDVGRAKYACAGAVAEDQKRTSCNIGGLSTALQNAVDKPLMPVGLPHLRFSG
ncbi:unnamed protein product [Ranitomeya imitator]|uniref:Helix-turn-helix domain-containing protein n=1 Tax=Ranitomeya imitator TaxID=111125 RepID=A0ABN9M894_9NEOB|nr:unnamed protein product [Ranitomeya imitator]